MREILLFILKTPEVNKIVKLWRSRVWSPLNIRAFRKNVNFNEVKGLAKGHIYLAHGHRQ